MEPSDSLYDYIKQLESMGATVSNINNDGIKAYQNFDIDFDADQAEKIMPVLTDMLKHFKRLEICIETY